MGLPRERRGAAGRRDRGRPGGGDCPPRHPAHGRRSDPRDGCALRLVRRGGPRVDPRGRDAEGTGARTGAGRRRDGRRGAAADAPPPVRRGRAAGRRRRSGPRCDRHARRGHPRRRARAGDGRHQAGARARGGVGGPCSGGTRPDHPADRRRRDRTRGRATRVLGLRRGAGRSLGGDGQRDRHRDRRHPRRPAVADGRRAGARGRRGPPRPSGTRSWPRAWRSTSRPCAVPPHRVAGCWSPRTTSTSVARRTTWTS